MNSFKVSEDHSPTSLTPSSYARAQGTVSQEIWVILSVDVHLHMNSRLSAGKGQAESKTLQLN